MSAEAVPGDAVKVLFVDDEFVEFRSLKKKIGSLSEPAVDVEYSQSISDALEKVKGGRFDLILLDNRLLPNADFRETVPELRGIGYTGPIGVVSTDISDGYFQEFPDYGVDFRIGKDEIDARTLQYIIREFVKYDLPDFWKDDYTI
ncbi:MULTISPECIES: response regulator [Rhizobium]|uniref:CheY-like chemotaxis protein n=3 Tax=Rhizobium TaxID=379 RepID=A0A7W6WEF8_9HYPH|nr:MULTISPECIES: response regulator [Rhizobium]OWK26604.1 chemotaxis protein CheY [Rhizobium yanglingense]APO66378.1 response regulator CheY-like domain-containing protein [Rhizobium gallicum]MBB4227612.1 CheY-like chemotaxis protein [Rhizobium mongolense]MBB4274820.1 CheY-like chemotaxis protein [Rhizobium mongolense]QPB20243.1 response regulator [Rhizobium sp. 007]